MAFLYTTYSVCVCVWFCLLPCLYDTKITYVTVSYRMYFYRGTEKCVIGSYTSMSSALWRVVRLQNENCLSYRVNLLLNDRTIDATTYLVIVCLFACCMCTCVDAVARVGYAETWFIVSSYKSDEKIEAKSGIYASVGIEALISDLTRH
jgi:hypothetical protein